MIDAPMSSDPILVPDERWPDAAVLVVDDEPGMRHFLLRTLAPRVDCVDEAGSAEQAAERLAGRHYDLILLDIALPGRSGIDWLKELRAQDQACEVVLITAFADLDTAIEAMRAGAGDLLLKPFRVTQMLNALRQAIYVQPYVAALPGLMIFLTSMCFNLMSDGFRSAMDVRLNK